MQSYFKLVTFSFIFLLFSVAVRAQEKPLDLPPNIWMASGINGAWRINNAESDNLLSKMQAIVQSKLTQTAAEKSTVNETLPTMSISLVAPETLILASDGEKVVTINEGFDEIVFTRTIATDGKTHNGELQDGTTFFLTAEQSKDLLKIETVSPRGNKMTETYQLTNEGKKLVVTVRVETPEAKELLTLRRVYDRTTLDIFPNGTEEIQ